MVGSLPEKEVSDGSPFSRVALAALIPLVLLILSCSNPTSPTNPTNPSGTNYKVIFDSRGGTAVAETTVKSGEKVTAPSSITRAGYILAGWSINPDGNSGTMWDFASSTVNADVTLYAQWTAANLKDMTYNHNYGTTPQTTVVKVPGGSTTTAPGGITRAGYALASWNTKADGSGTTWNFASSTVNADVTLYAQWVLGGRMHKSGDPEPEAPTRPRMAFLGWYKDKDLTQFTNRVDFSNQPGGGSDGTFVLYPKFVSAAGYGITPDGTLYRVPSTAATLEIPYTVNEIAVKKLKHNEDYKSILGATISAPNTVVTKVYLPTKNLETIGIRAFWFSEGITSITIPGNVIAIEFVAFYHSSNLASIKFSSGLRSIGYGSFGGTKLRSVTIPSTVTSIKTQSFVKSESVPSRITSVRVEALIPPAAESYMFERTSSLLSIKVPPGKGAAYKAALGWSTYADKISEYTD